MSEQEFVVRIPQRNENKSYHIMKFNSSLGVDVAKWNQVRMVREPSKKDKGQEEEMPKFGAGSEFGRQQKEEARRKKFGFVSKKNDPDSKPWLMRVGSKKEGKHYKGIREGGVAANTTYYVFTHAQDGAFEVHPVREWYNFTPRATYKTLNAEEAEEKFAERNKILNHFAVLVNKKLKPEGEDGDSGAVAGDDEEGGSKGSKATKNLKISDMDDWVDSDDGLDTSEDEDGNKKSKKEPKKSKDAKAKKKKSKHDVENEAFEDSDDGDDEGNEVDYITDESSESETEVQEKVELKGVDQAEGLSKLLDSESSSEDEDEEKKKKEDKDEEGEDEKKKSKKKKDKDSKNDEKGGKKSASNSRSTTPTPEIDEKAVRAEKRKALVENVLDPNAEPTSKKSRIDHFGSAGPSASSSGTSNVEAMFEEDVRRYLARKPMTTTDILKKIKSKRAGLHLEEELMPLLVSTLKRINPHQQKVKGKMYLSLKK